MHALLPSRTSLRRIDSFLLRSWGRMHALFRRLALLSYRVRGFLVWDNQGELCPGRFVHRADIGTSNPFYLPQLCLTLDKEKAHPRLDQRNPIVEWICEDNKCHPMQCHATGLLRPLESYQGTLVCGSGNFASDWLRKMRRLKCSSARNRLLLWSVLLPSSRHDMGDGVQEVPFQ